MNDLVSIIIRTKNEERWITQCLQEVFSQKYINFEVILVDNESTDKTIEKAQQFNIQKIVTCRNYKPGKALNQGIRESKGKYIVCLSGHCIPVNEQWLGHLIKNFDDPEVAGIYGRQEPLSFSSDSDKRDLTIVFGLDRKIQRKDSFFHNANSAIRRDLWEKCPFDENITNIEDRLWAQAMLYQQYKIIYEPEASVYHHHGIHHGGEEERCAKIVKILENLKGDNHKITSAEKLNIVSIIPVRGSLQYLNNKPLIAYTIQRALESKHIKKVIVSTDDMETAEIAKKLGAEVPFIRDPSYSKEYVDILKVLQYSLEKVEVSKIYPDLIVSLEPTFPFRTTGLIDKMILKLLQQGYDSVIAAKKENKALWKEEEDGLVQIEEGMTPRKFKNTLFMELRGLGCVTHPEFVRQGKLLGEKVGIYEISYPYSSLEIREEADLDIMGSLLQQYF